MPENSALIASVIQQGISVPATIMIEVSSLKLSQFLLRSTVSDGISRSVQISNRIFLSLSIAPVVTPLVFSAGRQGLLTQVGVQPPALLPFIQVCRQQPFSLRALRRVGEGKLKQRTIALPVVQQLPANPLIRLIRLLFRSANSLTQFSLASSSNLHLVPRSLNQLPLKQESGA